MWRTRAQLAIKETKKNGVFVLPGIGHSGALEEINMPRKWKMPKWMEPYRQYVTNTAGNSIEDLMNGNADPRVNLPLSTIQFGVKSQVHMLVYLHTCKRLK